ncbi:hypothetical protein [Acinetobacter lwoffii]|uniref:hypothetical protein n=1 Tax=Acinetobacter lwoffii TaxID=28090 RepID=UPI00300BC553
MNLIEQLGGYEAVKQAAVNYKNSGDRVTAAGLELQCLEYRRQHNIYEVGDDVVCKYEHTHLFGDVVLEIAYFRDDLKELGRFVRFTNGNDFKLDALRHATDAEIKAGRRLPVIESDDCSDIRNHISPNTVVIEG